MSTVQPKKRIDWPSLEVKKFSPTIYTYNAKKTCGTAALAVITGEDPYDIDVSPIKGKSKHWSDRAILRYLTKRKYEIYPISVPNIKTSNTYVQQPITENHVVLLSMRVTSRQSTWCVLFKDLLYHGAEILPLRPMEFLNNKLYSSYVLFRPEWGYSNNY